MGRWTDRTQWDTEIDRAIAGRCRKCGSTDTEPGGLRVEWGMPKGVGVLCHDCGYHHDGVGVVADRPFIPPGREGSYDDGDDYEWRPSVRQFATGSAKSGDRRG